MKKGRYLPKADDPALQNDAAYWRDQFAKSVQMLRSYKRRQDAVALELGKAMKNPAIAEVVIQGVMEQTLPVAAKRVKDREDSLASAVQCLKSGGNAKNTLDYIKRLCPDVFSALEK